MFPFLKDMDSHTLAVVSGGQTGVDRAALDAAMDLGLPCGGWCPKGRRAEDGPIPDRYPLSETASRSYPERTWRNMAESSATLILHVGGMSGGTRLTQVNCRKLDQSRSLLGGYPHLAVRLDAQDAHETILRWLLKHEVAVLNVAGPRESRVPGIHRRARALLRDVFRDVALSRGGGHEGVSSPDGDGPPL